MIRFFSRFANLSGPVYLWNATRLYQLALALFGMATIHTLLPTLSRMIKKGEDSEANVLFTFSFRRLVFVMIPCMVAILSMNFPLVDFLFGWGKFSLEATQKTANCLSAYSIALLPASAILLDSAVCYAKNDFRLPTFASIGAVVCNICCNIILIFGFKLGSFSIALSTSISAWGHFLFLRYVLAKKGWQIDIKKRDGMHVLGSTLFAVFLSKIGGVFFPIFLTKGFSLFIPAICFLFGLFLYGRVFRSHDLCDLFRIYFGVRNPYSSL